MWEMLEKLLVIATFSVGTSCGKRIPDDKVFGGRDAFNVPFLVSVQKYRKHVCGGSVLSWKLILTACHCTGDPKQDDDSLSGVVRYSVDNPKSYRVFAGEWDLELDSFRAQKVPVQRFLVHPNCSIVEGILEYDYAILMLVRKLIESPFVHPMKILGLSKEKYQKRAVRIQKAKHVYCWVMGWGLTSNGKLPMLPRASKMRLLDDQTCQYYLYPLNEVYETYDFTRKGKMCGVGVRWTESDCTGDSGGPVWCKGYVMGSVSYGFKCGRGDQPAVYAGMSEFVVWFKEILKNHRIVTRGSANFSSAFSSLFAVPLMIAVSFLL